MKELLTATASSQKADPRTVNPVDRDTPANALPLGPGGEWTLVSSEEFNGETTVVDSGRDLVRFREEGPVWQTRYPDYLARLGENAHFNHPGSEGGYYSLEQVSTAEGSLRLRADRLPVTAAQNPLHGWDYRTGMISSEPSQTFTYGAFEARVKCPGTDQFWPAFWTLRDGCSLVDWTQNYEELDIMEVFGSESEAFATLHTSEGMNRGSGPQIIGTVRGWHLFTAEWVPDAVRFYMDGKVVNEQTWSIPVHPHYVMVNLATYLAKADAPESGTMEIDYVRVWQNRG